MSMKQMKNVLTVGLIMLVVLEVSSQNIGLGYNPLYGTGYGNNFGYGYGNTYGYPYYGYYPSYYPYYGTGNNYPCYGSFYCGGGVANTLGSAVNTGLANGVNAAAAYPYYNNYPYYGNGLNTAYASSSGGTASAQASSGYLG